MKRLALAALGGVFIPICYFVVAALTVGYVENNTFKLLLIAPIEWPYWIYSLFFTPKPRADAFIPLGLTLSLYLGNFLLYSLLTYTFLSWRNIPKRLP